MPTHLFDDDRITAFGMFVEAYTGILNRLADQLGDHGLSLVEFEVLIRLSRSDGHQLRMSDLAAQTSLSTSGVTRVVDRMERAGLLCRQACETDRRALYATVTAAGLARLSETLPGHLRLIEQWFTSQLPAGELDRFLASLRTLRDAVAPGATSGIGPRPLP